MIKSLVISLVHKVQVYALTYSFIFLSTIPVELCAKFPWFYSWHLLKPSPSLFLYCPSLSQGHFHSLYYGIPKISQSLFLSLASIFTSHSPASTEMIFLKCEDIALSCLKLLDRNFQNFHGSLLPDNGAHTLQPSTQTPAWSGFSLTFSSLYCQYLLSCCAQHHSKPLAFPQIYGGWSY